ncbi:MAG: UDP-galactopyranose mutase [Nanoarchaeota archaeon]|nr:UDP-galactopyranose mutase [Nanoarchaeota archaeon]MBU1029794.1 UDP-galactopyranose mutase [Nanoarchaeota archaeon]MBU1850033.1 UDP-galactopyranose mutase [Nanoarchaeota archaeon]
MKKLTDKRTKISNNKINILTKFPENEDFEIVVVGAGISGAVIAERCARILRKKVLVIEKRYHIGGNCYDHFDKKGILIHKYGPHLFHTNYENVWKYVKKFSEWCKYEHKVLSYVDKKLVPIPVNINTVNILFGEHIKSENEMKKWLEKKIIPITNSKNSEESAISRVGKELYEKMFKFYTKKQWNLWPSELDASVMNRIPVRTNYEDRYFTDKYQFLPKDSYTKMFNNLLAHPNIKVLLNTDYFKVRKKLKKAKYLFYTGQIDRFFNYRTEKGRERLPYRSLRFKFKTYNKKYFQKNSVINYPEKKPSFTRIVEYKHFTKQKHPKTTISREFSKSKGEPYYPVPNPKNKEIFERFKKQVDKLKNVFFVGRLANYQYFNIDQTIKNALDLFKEFKKNIKE